MFLVLEIFNLTLASNSLEEVFKYFNKIDVRGAYQYIENIVKEKMVLNQKYIATCQLAGVEDNYNNAPSKNKKFSNFNNFEQRVYDYEALEKKLLGQEAYNLGEILTKGGDYKC